MPTIRLLLVDDSPEFLQAAANFLATDPEIEVVGQARSGQEALDQLAGQRLAIVLMDLAMPGMNGLETTRRIKAQPDAPRVIVLTLYDNPSYRALAQTAGADGFVAKSEFGSQLLPLIHKLCPPGGP